ncbi:MAG TPA: SIMPL domain-containing protein [archaeon]|nr:SIMPL domain-containing protein [archaeon]
MNRFSDSNESRLMPILAILVAAILIVVAFNAGSASSDRVVVTSDPAADVKTLSVSGSVTKMVTPDKVDIVLSVETLDDLANKSQSDNAILADKVRTALLNAGVASSEVKTISYSVNEEYEWNDVLRKSEPKGYKTINQIQVTLKDITKAGSVVDVAVNAGANRVSSISFGLSKEKELEVRKTALSEASSTAKAKADSIVQGLNVTLGKVYSISENSYYYTPVNYRDYDMAVGVVEEKASTPITAGDVEVTASVAVQFELN